MSKPIPPGEVLRNWSAQAGDMSEILAGALAAAPPPRGWRPNSARCPEEAKIFSEIQKRLILSGATNTELVALDQWVTGVIRYHHPERDTFEVYYPAKEDIYYQ